MPDLLESIIQPPGVVKEELRQKLFKMIQFGSKIKKIRVCTFQMSGKIPDSTSVAFEAVIFTHPHPQNQEKGVQNIQEGVLPKS